MTGKLILCDDVKGERQARVRKTVKKYLHPLQKSVMTGNLTDRSLGRLKLEQEPLIDPAHDCVTIWCCDSASQLTRLQIGVALHEETNIL